MCRKSKFLYRINFTRLVLCPFFVGLAFLSFLQLTSEHALAQYDREYCQAGFQYNFTCYVGIGTPFTCSLCDDPTTLRRLVPGSGRTNSPPPSNDEDECVVSYANFLNAIDTNHDGIITPEEITEYLRNRYPELRDIPFMELIFNKRIKEILARLERMMHDSVVTAINNALQAHQITEAEANNALRELNRLFKFDGKISLTEYLISVHWLGSALADILRDNESLMRWINQNLPGLRDLLNSLPENIRNQVLEYLLEGLSQFFGEDSDCVLFAIITYESSRRNCNKLLSDNDLKDICRQVLDCNDRPAGPTLEELMGEVSPGGGAGGAGMSLSN